MGLSDLLLLILGKYDNKNNWYENKLSTVIHNWHKMWRENVAFDNTFITKKSLKLHLNLSWFKLYTISPKKRQFILAHTYSPWKDTFKPPSWKAIWDRVRFWKHLPWIFLSVDLFLSLVSIIIQFLFSFSFLLCDSHQNYGKKQGTNIFSTGYPSWYIIIAISLRWLVLVIGFNDNSINTVSFSVYLPFYVIFIKNGKKQGIAIFNTGHPSWRVVEELQRVVAANPEEVAVGTDPNNH